MARYAVINADGVVVNVVQWDGESPWQPDGNFTVVQSDTLQIGQYQDGTMPPSDAPETPGIQPPNLDFELGITEQDRQAFTSDLTGFQVKLMRGTATLETPVKITDKNGVLREITIGDYLEASDYYHSALRALWEAQV